MKNFHPKYKAKNRGMLISTNTLSGTTDKDRRGEFNSQLVRKLEALNFQNTSNPLIKMNRAVQNIPQNESQG